MVLFLLVRSSRKRKATPTAKEPKPWKNEFQGLDLDIWMHLGYQSLKLENIEYTVHLFCQREDHSKRCYKIQGASTRCTLLEEYHSYIHKYTQPWSMGSGEIYLYNHCPSKDLRNYMIETYAHIWDPETKWWIPSDGAKYTAAKSKQKATKTEKKPSPVTEVDENVVKVDFKKDKHES